MDYRARLDPLLYTGRLEEASGLIRAIPADDPQRSPLLHRLIRLWLRSRQLERAEAELEQLPGEDPLKLQFRKHLVQLYRGETPDKL